MGRWGMLNRLHTRTVKLVASLLIAASPKTGGGIRKNNVSRRMVGCREDYQRKYALHHPTSLCACQYTVLLTTRFRTWFWEARVSASANIIATTRGPGSRVMAYGIFETGIATVTAELYLGGARTALYVAPDRET